MFWYLLAAIHEAGHLVAGRLCGFRFQSVRVGPLKFEKPRKWSWIWRTKTLSTGRALMRLDRWPVRSIRLRYSLFILGGVGANLLCALLFFPLALRGTAFGAFCVCFIAGSLILVLANLLSAPNSGGDGSQLWVLLFRKSQREKMLLQFTLMARCEETQRLCRSGQLAAARQSLEELAELNRNVIASCSDTKALEALTPVFDNWAERVIRAEQALAEGTQELPQEQHVRGEAPCQTANH